jgi:hypothetical protein
MFSEPGRSVPVGCDDLCFKNKPEGVDHERNVEANLVVLSRHPTRSSSLLKSSFSSSQNHRTHSLVQKF